MTGNGSAGGHAVVIGGSMAGLLAARVLARHFERVTLIERDRFPEGPAFRKGVPQSRHLHVLLGKGRQLLDRFFPGFSQEMLAAGAHNLRFPADALWLTAAGWSERFDLGNDFLSSSRELLEWTVRRRLGASGRVRFLEEIDVTGLTATPDRRSVTGVTIRPRPARASDAPDADGESRAADERPSEEIGADLVVDASGRGSRAPRWMETLCYEAPEESRVNAFLGYASRVYKIPEGFDADWRLLFLQARAPDAPRGGALFPIEGGRWIVTVAGMGRDYPPTDEDGFLQFARGLRTPILYEAIRDAEPLTGIAGYQRTENQRRHWERLARRPERFLVTGDAACAFNPIYGQGMTVAAEDAMSLHRSLKGAAGCLDGVAAAFQPAVAKTNAAAWLLATAEDMRYPTTEGARPDRMTRLMYRYMDRLGAVATHNQRVTKAFGDVVNLLAPPTSLFRPDILLPVLLDRGTVPDAAPTATLTGSPRVSTAATA